jgi:hypothetical protein
MSSSDSVQHGLFFATSPRNKLCEDSAPGGTVSAEAARQPTHDDDHRAARWRSGLDTNCRRLFFTDIGGYKFLVAPESLESRAAIQKVGDVPDAKQPIISHAEISPAKVRAGEALELIVTVKVAPTCRRRVARARRTHDLDSDPSEWSGGRQRMDLPPAGPGHRRPDDLPRDAEIPPPAPRRARCASRPDRLEVRVRLSGLRSVLVPAPHKGRPDGQGRCPQFTRE